MRRLLPIALLLLASTSHAGDAGLPFWRALDAYQGAWRGNEQGMLGRGQALRCTSDLFDGRFMLARTRSTIELETGERDVDDFSYWQVFGRDPDSGRVSLEQFESAGYHRRFELDPNESRPDALVFRATELGDASTDRFGMLTLRILRGGERYEEVLRLGEADNRLREVRRTRFRRMDATDTTCEDTLQDLPAP